MIKRFIEFLRIKSMNKSKYLDYLRKKGVLIGEGCEIYKDVNFGSEPYLIQIGNNVRISAHSKLITHDGGMWTLRKMGLLPDADKFGKIKIGDNCHIGTGVTIMLGVNIGKNCIIGCNAVVTKDIPDNSVAVGVPARIIESIDDYYIKNKDKIECTKHMNREEKKEYLKEKYR